MSGLKRRIEALGLHICKMSASPRYSAIISELAVPAANEALADGAARPVSLQFIYGLLRIVAWGKGGSEQLSTITNGLFPSLTYFLGWQAFWQIQLVINQ